jgi:hypothetical protein
MSVADKVALFHLQFIVIYKENSFIKNRIWYTGRFVLLDVALGQYSPRPTNSLSLHERQPIVTHTRVHS